MTENIEPVAYKTKSGFAWNTSNPGILNADGATALYTASQLQAALDRAERAEKERDANIRVRNDFAGAFLQEKDRATTAEAALAEARKVIEGARAAISLVTGNRVKMGEFAPLYGPLVDIEHWLSAHPAKETKG